MNLWIKAGILVIALIIGAVIGWKTGKKMNLHSPNLAVNLLIMLCGAVGGPLIMYKLAGRSFTPFPIAVFITGLAIGIVYWPVSENKSEGND